MIYWSIVPLETVLEGYDEPARQPLLQEIDYHGVAMIVESVGVAEVKIHRLLSPVPADYLRPEWLPGQIIRL